MLGSAARLLLAKSFTYQTHDQEIILGSCCYNDAHFQSYTLYLEISRSLDFAGITLTKDAIELGQRLLREASHCQYTLL